VPLIAHQLFFFIKKKKKKRGVERKGGLQNTGNFNHREGKKKMKEFFPLIIFSINKTLWLPLFWLLSPVRSGGEKEQKKFFFFCFSSLAFTCSVFIGAPTNTPNHPPPPSKKKKGGESLPRF
jgi:hypothetical protein